MVNSLQEWQDERGMACDVKVVGMAEELGRAEGKASGEEETEDERKTSQKDRKMKERACPRVKLVKH